MSEQSPSDLINAFLTELHDECDLGLRKALAGDYSGMMQFSPVGQKFVDDDEFLFTKVLPRVAQLLSTGEFGRELVAFQKKMVAAEIEEHYVNLAEERIKQECEIILIEAKEKILDALSIATLEENANAVFRSAILPLLRDPSPNQTEKNYFYAYVLNIAYNKFVQNLNLKKKYNRTETKENLIWQYYKSIDIDITKLDQQFRKYDLYSVGVQSEVFVALPSRIIDRANNLQFIVEMQEALLHMLVDAHRRGHIKDLALLARSQDPIESDLHISILLGTHQRQAAPKIQDIYHDDFPYVVKDVIESLMLSADQLFSSHVIYKFHENDCDDAIWVFSKGNNVEFEEVLEEPEILDDCVVTQMIHLEYVIEDERVKISHIDHEYLFYSYEEFDRRLEDYTQRAGAKKRIKTFKVDRSTLPLVFEDGTFSLYAVLAAYFEKAYFLQEFLVHGCGLKDVAEMVRQIEERNSSPQS